MRACMSSQAKAETATRALGLGDSARWQDGTWLEVEELMHARALSFAPVTFSCVQVEWV